MTRQRPNADIFFRFLGAVSLLSACVVHPWIGRFYRPHVVDYADVMGECSAWAAGVGVALLAMGWLRLRGERVVNMAVLLSTLAFVVLVDRGLLAYWGRSPWIVDPVLHYRHRPDQARTFRSWYRIHQTTLRQAGDPGQKWVRINRWGFHDEEFAREPAADELRGVLIGDSVTMGHGVDRNETFASALEEILEAHDSRHAAHQMINMGIQGYGTAQEAAVLEESLEFKPVFALVGFCLNDVPIDSTETEVFYPPCEVRRYGLFLQHLLTETGMGLTVQKLRQYRYSLTAEQTESEEEEKRRRLLAEHYRSKEPGPGVRSVLKNLEAIYRFGEENQLDVALLILPARGQLFDEEMQSINRTLAEHAAGRGIDCIDLTDDFEAVIEAEVTGLLSRKQIRRPAAGIMELLRELQANAHFMDGFHFTARGHRTVAWRLAAYLNRRYGLGFDPARFGREWQQHGASAAEIPGKILLPPDLVSIVKLVEALKYVEEYQKAAGILQMFLGQSLHREARSLLLFLLGDVQLKMGLDEPAAEGLRESFSLLEGDWPWATAATYTLFGNDFLQLGLLDQAVAAFQRALEKEPGNRAVREILATLER